MRYINLHFIYLLTYSSRCGYLQWENSRYSCLYVCCMVFYCDRWCRCWLHAFQRKRPESACLSSVKSQSRPPGPTLNANNSSTYVSNVTLTGEEIRILRRAREEHSRRGGWVRIFPSPSSWDTYRWLLSAVGFPVSALIEWMSLLVWHQ